MIQHLKGVCMLGNTDSDFIHFHYSIQFVSARESTAKCKALQREKKKLQIEKSHGFFEFLWYKIGLNVIAVSQNMQEKMIKFIRFPFRLFGRILVLILEKNVSQNYYSFLSHLDLKKMENFLDIIFGFAFGSNRKSTGRKNYPLVWS